MLEGKLPKIRQVHQVVAFGAKTRHPIYSALDDMHGNAGQKATQ